ncbi:MAG: efflux RND transporter periplasmic adaptor subunit [Fidelibacterota bacterium]
MKYRFFNQAMLTVVAFSILSCSSGKKGNEETGTAADTNPEIKEVFTVPVEAAIVKKSIVEASIPFTGILKPISSVDIVSEVSGKVKNINKNLGQSVSREDELAIIDDEIPYYQFRQALSQKLSAENNLKIAKLNLESDELLFNNEDISKIAYENSNLAVKNSEANLLAAVANLSLMERNYNNTRIKSPITGILSRKYIELGTMVNPGMVLYRVIDFTTLKVEIGISQDLINNAKVGSKANITISALGNETFQGEVRYLSPEADEITGTYKIEIHLANTSDMKIRAGMTAKVDLMITELKKQLTISSDVIVSKNGDFYVYKIEGNIAKLTKIETGHTFGSQTVVFSGLKEGEMIVVTGMKNLGENTRVYLENVDE